MSTVNLTQEQFDELQAVAYRIGYENPDMTDAEREAATDQLVNEYLEGVA